MVTITAQKRVSNCGNSLVLNITEQASRLGLIRGDIVDVSISIPYADTETADLMPGHEFQIALREDVSVRVLQSIIREWDAVVENDEEYGFIVKIVFNDKEEVEGFEQMYGCWAVAFAQDMDQERPEGSFL